MKSFKRAEKRMKKMDVCDLKLVKLSVAAVILALVSGWTWFQNWVLSVHWLWFAAAAVLFALRPMKKFYFST